MNTNDKITRKSKYKVSYLPVLCIIAIIVLAVVAVIEIAAIAKYSKRPDIVRATDVLIASPSPYEAPTGDVTGHTSSPEETQAGTYQPGESYTPSQTEVSQNTPTQPSSPTPTPTPTPTPGNTPAVSGIDDVAARIVDPSTIDFSFLDGVSREKFEDTTDEHGAWYPGAVKKDSAGNITYPWDRYKSTLDCLSKYGAIYRKNSDQKVCYLTFDCGYENGNTNDILDTLKEKNVQAIFFVTGGFIDYGDLTLNMMKRMLAEGHLIGSHTEHHKIMPTLSDEEFVTELNTVYRRLKDALGEDFTMLFYRPPEGAATPRDLALANYLGYHTTFWSFAYGDYNVDNQPDPAASLEKMKNQLHPGCVYLLHAVSKTNATVLGDLIDYIRAEGYEIRRIDQ